MLRRYCALAREKQIWLSLGGFQEKIDGDRTKVHNAHLIVNDQGEIVSKYHKIHLFDVDVPGGISFRESSHTKAGTELVVADSPVGKLGLSVCYDLRFPELYGALTRKGAEVLLVPAAFTLKTGIAHWHALLRATAIQNQCYVMAAAQTGAHNTDAKHQQPPSFMSEFSASDDIGVTPTPTPSTAAAPAPAEVKKPAVAGGFRESFGHALVVDPWGAVIGECEEGTGLVVAEIDLDKIRAIRKALPVGSHRRPDLYYGKL